LRAPLHCSPLEMAQIVSSLVSMPMRFIMRSLGRPPTL
jgi:hypothetical protein